MLFKHVQCINIYSFSWFRFVTFGSIDVECMLWFPIYHLVQWILSDEFITFFSHWHKFFYVPLVFGAPSIETTYGSCWHLIWNLGKKISWHYFHENITFHCIGCIITIDHEIPKLNLKMFESGFIFLFFFWKANKLRRWK